MPDDLRHGVCGRVLESAWATMFLPDGQNYSEPPYCSAERCCDLGPERCPAGPCPIGSAGEGARRDRFESLAVLLSGSAMLYGLACLAHPRRRDALVRGVRACVRISLWDADS